MKKETKQKIKNKLSKLKKPLMILSIVFNILFSLALVIGLTSNNKSHIVSAEDSQVSSLSDTSWYLNQNVTCESGYGKFDINYYLPNSNNGLGASCDKLYIGYGPSNSPNTSSVGRAIFHRTGDYPAWFNMIIDNSVTGEANRTIVINGGGAVTDSSLISWFYSNAVLTNIGPTNPDYVEPNQPVEPDDTNQTYIDTINLGNNFNPNSFICENGDYIFNGFGALHSGFVGAWVLRLTGFEFVSNGEPYNEVLFVYQNLPGYVITEDGSTYINTNGDSTFTDYVCCTSMQYILRDVNNSDNSTNVINKVIVTSLRRFIVNDSGTTINCIDVRPPFIIYINDAYRIINVISDSGSFITGDYLTITGKTSTQLLKVTNSSTESVMGLTNVFGLMKGAFNGITDILSISILPGITLGLLLFIPLIVTIIIAVVRLIKK